MSEKVPHIMDKSVPHAHADGCPGCIDWARRMNEYHASQQSTPPPPSQHREPIEADREENWSNALETAHQMLRHHAGSHICPSGKTGAVVPYTLAKALLAAALYHRLAFSTPAASDAEGEA